LVTPTEGQLFEFQTATYKGGPTADREQKLMQELQAEGPKRLFGRLGLAWA